MISEQWFRPWPGAVKQQAINWANVDPDLWCYMISLGHSELQQYEASSVNTKRMNIFNEMIVTSPLL